MGMHNCYATAQSSFMFCSFFQSCHPYVPSSLQEMILCPVCFDFISSSNKGVPNAGFDCNNHPYDESKVFECDSGECIDKYDKCDNHDDCADGSDEGPETCSEL